MPPRGPAVRRSSDVAAYGVLLTLGALDAAGYGVIAPVVPAIADETGAGPALIGILVAMFAVGMAAGFVVGGRLAQRRHASVAAFTGLAVIAAGCIGFLVGGGFAVYAISRFLTGVGSGLLWMGITLAIVERFPGQEYRRLTGLLAAYAVGGIAGPAIGAVGGVRGPFALLLALTCACALAFAAIGAPTERLAFVSDRSALRHPSFWLASAAILLVSIAVGAVDGPLPLHFAAELSQREIGVLYVGAALMLGASAALAGRFEPRPLLVAGTLLMVAGITVAGMSESVPVWFLAVPVTAVGFGIGEAGATGILLEAVGADRIVVAMVAWSQVWAIGYLVGPAVGGAVAETLGFAALGLVPLGGAAIVAVAFMRAPRPLAAEVRS